MTPMNRPGDTFTNVVHLPVSFTYDKDSLLGLDAQENPDNSKNELITARDLFEEFLDNINENSSMMVIGLPPIQKEE